MNQRLAALPVIAGYGVSQLVRALRGKDSAFPLVHDLAWFQSSGKKLPTVSVEELFPGTSQLAIQLQRTLPRVTGNVTMDELAAIAVICRWLNPSVVFEFGTFNGRTTLNLAANTSAETKIYTLDLADPATAQLATSQDDGDYHLRDGSGSHFRDSEFRGKIEQLWSDSARFDESRFHAQVDLVFVDGAHSIDYVRSDTTKALAMLKPGGVILWHDYCSWYPGVFEHLHELLPRYSIKHIEGTHLAVLRG